MKHTSVSISPCEFINVTPVNPLISKCQIKVCYVGDEPNRNRSVITKEVAQEMANSLPGSPIVGFYNEQKGDFEEHNRSIDISNGEFKIKDTTKPYGFVDLGAKCWFETFLDDGIYEHEYLMTEGYLWTGQYPECQRILEKGNNQSMELDEKTINANWAFDENNSPDFFIINEAIISKLCILGEDCEPCFEGSQISTVRFSFEDGFKQELFAMMNELKKYLNKGGTQVFTTYSVEVGDALWTALYSHIDGMSPDTYTIDGVFEDEGQKYAVLKDADGKFSRLDFSMNENGFSAGEQLTEVDNSYSPEKAQFSASDVKNFISEFKKKNNEEDKKDKKTSSENDSKSEDEKDSSDESENSSSKEDDEESKEDDEESKEDDEESKEDDEENKKKKKYSLEEIPEYIELFDKFSKLESNYTALMAERDSLKAEVEPLRVFRAEVERKQKEEMIESFYMLSNEDKEDVLNNINRYSLEDIESKLSVICVRKKVNFDIEKKDNDDASVTFRLGSDIGTKSDSMPAWIKAVMDTAKTLN